MQINTCTNFIKSKLPTVLLESDQFKGQKLVKWEFTESATDFGFMSTILDGQLITTGDDDDKYDKCCV